MMAGNNAPPNNCICSEEFEHVRQAHYACDEIPTEESAMRHSIAFDNEPESQRRNNVSRRRNSSSIDDITFQAMETLAVQGDSTQEFRIREALSNMEAKRDSMLDHLYSVPKQLEDELQLDAIRDARELFAVSHPDPHPVMKKALELVELSTVCVLVRTARRFQIRIEQINDRIAKDSQPILEFGGWKEECDEDGQQCFINTEGLRRFDVPADWWNEEVDRERRFEENHLAIDNTENFVISRVENLLAEIEVESRQCRNVVSEIEQELEKHEETDGLHQELIDARNLTQGIAQNITERVLEFFDYKSPCVIPQLPGMGMTNAFSQRRLRSRPNFQQELEDFFDDEELP